MKTKLTNLLILLQAAAALCTIGAVKFWAPACSKMLELASGAETPMKCHYAGQAAMAVAVIIFAIALAAFLSKSGHKALMIVNAVAAIVLFLVFSNVLIGICASETMRCHTTALWGRGAAIVVIAASLIELLTSKEGQLPGGM